MKHLKTTSRNFAVPAKASLLETEQKIAVFGAFAAALGTLGESIGIILGIQADQP